MTLFVFAALGIAVIHLIAAVQRPRLAVIVSGFLWVLYAVYESMVATGVLCEKDCNIRVDLVFLFPILALATFCAHRAYKERPIPWRGIGITLGIIGLFVVSLVVEGQGYQTLSHVMFVLGALAIGIYAFKSRRKTNPP